MYGHYGYPFAAFDSSYYEQIRFEEAEQRELLLREELRLKQQEASLARIQFEEEMEMLQRQIDARFAEIHELERMQFMEADLTCGQAFEEKSEIEYLMHALRIIMEKQKKEMAEIDARALKKLSYTEECTRISKLEHQKVIRECKMEIEKREFEAKNFSTIQRMAEEEEREVLNRLENRYSAYYRKCEPIVLEEEAREWKSKHLAYLEQEQQARAWRQAKVADIPNISNGYAPLYESFSPNKRSYGRFYDVYGGAFKSETECVQTKPYDHAEAVEDFFGRSCAAA